MTTAVPTPHRSTHLTTMIAAAAAAVVLGGAAAVGFAVSQDNTDTASGSGTTTSTHYPGCTDPRCLPHAQGNNSPRATELPVAGGKTISWVP